MPKNIADIVYPERRFGGFTRYDGTVEFCARVQAMLQPGDVVLDVGCGRGAQRDDACAYRRDLRDFRGDGRMVIGIDVDPAAAENPYVDDFRQIEDVRRWPVDDASIDVLHSNYVLEHVEEPDAFFSEIRRVLKPGGKLALRAPNSLGYVAICARLIPNRLHAKVVGRVQESRKEEDVFPTVYRCNTAGKLRRALRRHGFDGVVYATEAEPSYMSFSRLAYRLAAVVHRWLPPMFRSTLLAFAEKTALPGELPPERSTLQHSAAASGASVAK